MLSLFAGDIFTDQAVRNITYIVIASLALSGFVLGLLIFGISKVIQKLRGTTAKGAVSLQKSLAIGLLAAAAFGVVFLVVS